ncbi:MAG TPA: RNA polymerase-binding protein DksA [Herbaspirillum sp.]|jgi:DnaK suppressor protein
MAANVKKTANAAGLAGKTVSKKTIASPTAKPARKAPAGVVKSLPVASVKTGALKKAGQANEGQSGPKANVNAKAKESKATKSSPLAQQATAGSDKFRKPVVSKVSEVATKNSPNTAEAKAGDDLLTEAQILKMGEKDYMNEAQLAFFKARLQQLERELVRNAGETTEHLRETVLVPDPADRATIEEEHALELRTRDRERKLLKKVQQSIASIDTGEYGWCEETGEPIGVPRLLARPTATLSLEAQQRRELKQKLYGD